MIDEEFLNNLVSSSFYPEKLMHLMGMERDEKGNNTDLGHFSALDKCCTISLGLDNGLERAPNAERANIRLRDYDIQKICDILNKNNFPAVTADNAGDVSKILVTDSGIQLPYQKAEEALSMLSDVVDVLQEHPDIVIQGFAHPLTKDSMTPAKVGEVTWYAEVEDNAQNQSILDANHTTKEAFVTEMLESAKDTALSQSQKDDIIENSPGKTLYRGATLGDKPYAVMAKVDCKSFVYASGEFSTAQMYADDFERGYTAPDGKKYGFIYEYEVDKNQKYYCDYGLENAQRNYDEAGYETNVYNHKNKLKGIYIQCDGKTTKIADENGYISKKWEDFAKLHNPTNRMENEKLVLRNNAIYEAAQEERPLCRYTKRNYDYSSLSVEEVEKQKIRGTNEAIHLRGKVSKTDIIENLSGPFIIKNAGLENINLGDSNIELQGQFTCNFETKFPASLKLKNAIIPNEADLSKVERLTLDGGIKIGDEAKIPAAVEGFWVVISDSKIKADTDYAKIENLTLSGKTIVEENTRLPDKTILKDVELNAFDFSNIKQLSLKGIVELGEGTKLPDNIGVSELRMLKIHDADISQLAKLSSYLPAPIVVLDEKNNPVCAIGSTYGNAEEILRNEGFGDLKRYPSIEAYSKCKAVEEKLTSWGIDKDSYMMITPEHDVYTSYNQTEHRSMKPCFEECKNDIERTNSDVVYGSNNGVIAAYFKEDVYIISKNPEIRNTLYSKGKDTSIGVAMSNGEEFRTSFNDPYKNLNQEYAKIAEWKPKEQQAENSQLQEAPLSDKEKLAALSGRTNTARTNSPVSKAPDRVLEQSIDNKQVTPQTPQAEIKSAQLSAPEAVVTAKAPEEKKSLPKKIADMSKKGLREFISNLRKGYNMLTKEGMNPIRSTTKEANVQQQTNAGKSGDIKLGAMLKAKSPDRTL